MVINRGSENKNAVVELAKKYRVKRVVVSAYDAQANEMMKRDHKLIVNALLKMSTGESINWV